MEKGSGAATVNASYYSWVGGIMEQDSGKDILLAGAPHSSGAARAGLG